MSYGDISEKQREILEFLKNSILNRGYPPAVREICKAVHLKSTSSVHAHLEALEQNGYIRKDPSKPRAIEIIDDNFNLTRRELINVPIIRTVTAGQPILAVENIRGYFPILSEYANGSQTFMLTMTDDSMKEAGIFAGDYLLVEESTSAKDGDIIAVLLEGSVTVKRYEKEKDEIRLQPENDSIDLSDLPEGQSSPIIGKVIGLFRRFTVTGGAEQLRF